MRRILPPHPVFFNTVNRDSHRNVIISRIDYILQIHALCARNNRSRELHDACLTPVTTVTPALNRDRQTTGAAIEVSSFAFFCVAAFFFFFRRQHCLMHRRATTRCAAATLRHWPVTPSRRRRCSRVFFVAPFFVTPIMLARRRFFADYHEY